MASQTGTKISKQGLRDQVYARLHEMIENRRFSPGERINVEKLTEELGVSRTPVWQAVGLLEKEGILVYNSYQGVFIKQLTAHQAVNLYSVRETLECMAAQLAVNHVTSRLIGRMEKNLAEQDKIINNGQDMIAYSKLDFAFHAEIYLASQNEYLIEFLDSIKNKMRPLVNNIAEILPGLYEDHQVILQAMKTRDAELASNTFRCHNERMKELIIK